MYTIMNTRLKQFLAAENITQAQFADSINVVRASVSHVLSGRNNPSFDFIKAMMVQYPRLNIEWLMFGKGKMYKDQMQIQSTNEHLFPTDEPDNLFTVEDSVQDESIPSIPSSNEFKNSNEATQHIVNQRKVVKVIVMFDDGTFQEM